ncbi:MAG: arginase family protein [Lewinellaceae bacterium]|nr:arginase family protein [Phaeodactylibacter sp.]MCB9036186.1 arginase family protein [Lewinellaceae bacterium]
MFQNWLQPLKGPVEALEDHQFGRHIQRYTDELPELKDTRVAIIGIGEEDARAVRNELYRMSYPFRGLEIADLGDVRNTETSFIIPLIRELLDSQIFPLILGNAARQALAQYKAFQSLQQLISLAVVDERIAYSRESEDKELYFLKEILDSKHSRLFHLSFIGCQAHFVPPGTFEYLDKRNFDYTRLGKAKAEPAELEPLIRDCDLLSINLSALKQADAPGQQNATPSGFTSEEACQIARYAGMSDKLKALGLYGFQHSLDRESQTANAMAQMAWYFLDGFYHRKGDFPASTDGLAEYIVDFKKMDYQLTFWRSDRSGRWWMQVPVKTRSKYQRHRLVPCSYNDYMLACKDELPDRLLNAMRRFG